MKTVRRPEWTTVVLPEARLGGADRARLQELAAGRRLEFDELRQGLRLRTRSWIGVVQLDAFRMEIVPKLAGGIGKLASLISWTLGLGSLEILPESPDVPPAEQAPVDVIALLLAERCEHVLRRGLMADYIEREQALPLARGRILADSRELLNHQELDRSGRRVVL